MLLLAKTQTAHSFLFSLKHVTFKKYKHLFEDTGTSFWIVSKHTRLFTKTLSFIETILQL